MKGEAFTGASCRSLFMVFTHNGFLAGLDDFDIQRDSSCHSAIPPLQLPHYPGRFFPCRLHCPQHCYRLP